jgi:hypothetical protein
MASLTRKVKVMDFKDKLLKHYPMMRDALDKQFVEVNPSSVRIMFELLSLLDVQPVYSESELMKVLYVQEDKAHVLKGAAYLIEDTYDGDYAIRQVRDTWYIVNLKAGVQ